MEIAVMVGQLLLGLSILVGLHEMGHLLAAKFFGMRVEKYAIGFPPKVIGFTRGETEYFLGAIPLGGFVKISGMVDESLDTEQLGAEPQPWEFRAKPAWQRLIVMLAGIIVNVITGVLIFTFFIYAYGQSFLPISQASHGIVALPLAEQIGLRTGDFITGVNGKNIESFDEIYNIDALLDKNSYYTITRNGQTQNISIPANFLEKFSDRKNAGNFVIPAARFSVGKVRSGMPALKAGIQKGDVITSIDKEPIRFFHEFQQQLALKKGKTVVLDIVRNNKNSTIKVEVTPEGFIGFEPNLALKQNTRYYNLAESFPKGATMAFEIVWINIKGFGKIFRGEVSLSNSLSGPISMAQDLYGGIWDWQNFWRITGLLSMVLAFMNLLPIPALDGGHVVFLLYEMISGRKPSEKVLEWSQKIGMILLLGLMFFAFFNDIFKRLF